MKSKVYLLISIFLSLSLIGCSVGRKIDYRNLKMDFHQLKPESISLALLDHRKQVINGNKNPNFIGYLRSSTGIPYNLSTKSRNDFLNEISNRIVKSFNQCGVHAINIPASPMEYENSIKERLYRTTTDKKILFVFQEFHIDSYGIMFLHYDFELSIYNKENDLMFFKKYQDKEKLGGTVAFGAGRYKKYIPKAMEDFIENIFNDDEIKDVLNN